MFDTSADLAAMYAEWGEAVTLDGTPRSAILDLDQGEAFAVAGPELALRCIAAEVESLAVGAAAVVRGVSYRVRVNELLGPAGLERRLRLERA